MIAATDTAQTQALTTVSNAGSLGLVGNGALSIPMPFESKIVLFESVRIAGTTHAPGIDAIMEQMPDGAKLTLVREPRNQADKWAIRVEHNCKKIGYLPADRNELVARLMDGGKTIQAEMVESEQQGNWWKVYMEVSLVD